MVGERSLATLDDGTAWTMAGAGGRILGGRARMESIAITTATAPTAGSATRQLKWATKVCQADPACSARSLVTSLRWKTSDACKSGVTSAALSFSVTFDSSAR